MILELLANTGRVVERFYNIRVRGKSRIDCDSNSEFQHRTEASHEKTELKHDRSPLCQVEEEANWGIES